MKVENWETRLQTCKISVKLNFLHCNTEKQHKQKTFKDASLHITDFTVEKYIYLSIKEMY